MNIKRYQLFFIICLFIITCSCAHQNKPREIIQGMPAFHLKNYPGFNPETSLIDRLVPAPDFILEYLNALDNTDAYINYSPSDSEIAMIMEYLDLLPSVYKNILKQRLVGIYFIDNFTGSGMTDFILDNNDTIYCNLYINPDTMKIDITSWMTYRENSCFTEDTPEIFVAQECGTEYTGLFYLLFHETSHIVDYVCSVTPFVDDFLSDLLEKKDDPTEFTRGIWDSYAIPIRRYDFDQRSDITFYGLSGGPKISSRDAASLYRQLEQTPFTSLYSALSWAEDWAEFVTWYYFTSVYHQPYELQLYEADKLVSTYKPMEFKNVKARIPGVINILSALSW